jgi:hypothetical protein
MAADLYEDWLEDINVLCTRTVFARVMIQAIRDYTTALAVYGEGFQHKSYKSMKRKKFFKIFCAGKQAYIWIRSSRQDFIFSFENVCFLLKCDADKARKVLVHMKRPRAHELSKLYLVGRVTRG